MTLIILEIRVQLGEEIERGTPRRAASAAAREKLRTDVMDMTVDARQRLNALRREERDAGRFWSPELMLSNKGDSEVNRVERMLVTMREMGMMGRYVVVG